MNFNIFPSAKASAISSLNMVDVITNIKAEINLKGIETKIEEIVARGNAEQFATRGSRSGDPWVGTATLVDTGKMRTVATTPKVIIEPSNGFAATVTYSGEHSELILKHQFGLAETRQGKKGTFQIRVPVRIVIAYTASQTEEITRIAFDALLQKTRVGITKLKGNTKKG